MSDDRTARAARHAGGPGRGWRGARWRAGDLARAARRHADQMSDGEIGGASLTLCSAFFLLVFSNIAIPAPARRWCAWQFSLMCAAGLAWFVAARWRAWRARGTRRGDR